MPSLESAPTRGARLALLGALVAPLVVATAAIIVLPNLRFSGMAPRVRPIIETTTLLVAALITGVSYLRYSLDRDRLWLFVSLAFLVVTVHQFVFELILQPNGIAGADPTYLWLAARLEMGVLLLAAASTSRVSRRTDWSAARTYAVFGALALAVLAATQAAVLFATGGPDVPARVISSAADMGRADILLGSVCASVFLVAAGGLLLSKDREGSVLVWMSAALVMTAFSHLHYLLDPTLFTDRVSTGDLLRIATAGILVVAILADVRRSYAEVRARTIQLEAAYEAQRRRVLDLEQLDRIQADLHRMLNHEILHPVAAIRTLAMTLATKWDRIDEDTKLRSVEAMLDQSEQLRNLAGRASEQNDLRFDRELDRSPRRVNDIVVTVERTFPHLADRLMIVPPNGNRDVVLEVDERRLMQVFHNLFSNADRFAPQGSPIVVETERSGDSIDLLGRRPRPRRAVREGRPGLRRVLEARARRREGGRGAGALHRPADRRGARRADLGRALARRGRIVPLLDPDRAHEHAGGLLRMIRVVLVDDHQMFAEAIGMFLATESDIEVVEILGDANGVVERLRETRPDVVLMDIDLPGVDGVTATRRIVEARPETKVVLITALSDPGLVMRGVQAGASALVAKERAADDLVDVIRRTAAGEEIFPAPQLRLLTLVPGSGETETKVKLTQRELEVLQGLVDGMSTDELAAALFVSPRTVQGHVQSILTKLRVRSKLEAVVTGLRLGIVHLHPRPAHH